MAILAPVLKQRFFTAAGVPLAGGKLHTYAAGTTTPLATYTDYGGASANANPVILDANGECDVWLGSLSYKFVLTDSADVTQWTVDNVNQSTLVSRTSSSQLENIGVTCSVASSALTINLTDSLGVAPSSDSPVNIGFRSSTLSSGLSSTAQATSTTSIVIPSGATLGHSDNVQAFIYLYALNNGGVPALAVSTKYFIENRVVSTTAIGTGSDSATGLYSTAALTNVSIRLLARLTSTQTVAGTWGVIPSEIQTGQEAIRGEGVLLHVTKDSGNITSTAAALSFNNVIYDPYGLWSAPGTFSVPYDGWFTIYSNVTSAAFTPAGVFQSFLQLAETSGVPVGMELIGPQITQPSAGSLSYTIGGGAVVVYLRASGAYSVLGYQNSTASVGTLTGTGFGNYSYLKVVAGKG